jgi:hypothetical protein
MYIEMENTGEEVFMAHFKVHVFHLSGEAVKSSEIFYYSAGILEISSLNLKWFISYFASESLLG